jgi:hypothetical protein
MVKAMFATCLYPGGPPASTGWFARPGTGASPILRKYLLETITAAPALGETERQMPATAKRLAPTARLTMRCMPVRPRPPWRKAVRS